MATGAYPTSTPITVVTGANSGIGRATALYLAKHGQHVIGTVRSIARAEKLLAGADACNVTVEVVQADVADDESVRIAFGAILERHGRVDVLVNNAGIGGNGTVEDTSTDQYRDVLEVDLLGGIRCIQAVLPGMRDRRHGTIVNVSSVVGRFASAAQASYVAAKWAFEGVSEQLAQEVAGYGIRVAIIEPGITKTSIFGKNVVSPDTTGAYDEVYRRMYALYATGRHFATDAVEVAKVIHQAITTEHPHLRYLVSWMADELVDGRAAMTDDEWLSFGRATDDEAYARLFAHHYDIELGPALRALG